MYNLGFKYMKPVLQNWQGGDIYAIATAIARTNVPLSSARTWNQFHQRQVIHYEVTLSFTVSFQEQLFSFNFEGHYQSSHQSSMVSMADFYQSDPKFKSWQGR